MKMNRLPGPKGRRGYTMVELMVVFAIIALLAALITAGVLAALGSGNQTVVRHEIRDTEIALNYVKQQYGVKYLRSYLTLNAPQTDPSSIFLATMFGRRFQNMGWFGLTTPIVLEGEQCLVFYLGGIPQAGPNGTFVMTGFNSDPTNPMAGGGTPFFPFKSSRLVAGPNNGFAFPVYLDPYGTPYAFFSSGQAGNVYSADCQSLVGPSWGLLSSTAPVPYQLANVSPTQFLNPNSFQIISAGADKIFYPGGPWNPTTGVPGVDDMSNFSKDSLGKPQS